MKSAPVAYFEGDGVVIYHGDSRDIAPALKYDVVVTDPPYGADTATDSRRFTRRPSSYWRNADTSLANAHEPVRGDQEAFSPEPWIDRPAILWGANHYASRLPDSGGWLVWDKRRGAEDLADKGWPLGEAELAWTNVRGSTRVFRNLWSGMLRSSERGEFYHPTQKPVALMTWCLGFVDAGTVLDPFMGAGSTLLAAASLGRRCIGIELNEGYCATAVERLRQGHLALGAP